MKAALSFHSIPFIIFDVQLYFIIINDLESVIEQCALNAEAYLLRTYFWLM